MPHDRPISPHLQIYTLPITGIISICHRLTGVFLSIGLMGFVTILWQIRNGMLSYLQLQSVLQFFPVKLLIAGFIYALIFHLCHGIRHLIWDVGYSFSSEMLTRYALIEVIASLFLSIITLVVLL